MMQRSVLCAVLFGLSACGSETIVHKIDEKQANAIVVLLDDAQINAQKQRIDTGREVSYNIAVASKARMAALKVLQQNDYPKREVRDYEKVFVGGGLIPTASEEKAKKLSAIEGEIEKQLRLINDVLDAEVNIVMPEESALRTTDEAASPTTASVAIKYLPRGGSKPVSEPSVQAMVAASVEKLTPDRVVVVMTPVVRTDKEAQAAAEGRGTGIIGRYSPKTQTNIIIVVAVTVLVLCLALLFSQVRLRTVRGRLIKLQNEIARARRKAETPMSQQAS